jgi:hypothetical protein
LVVDVVVVDDVVVVVVSVFEAKKLSYFLAEKADVLE